MPTTRLVMEYDSESDGDDEEEDQLANSGVDDDSSDEVQVQRMVIVF